MSEPRQTNFLQIHIMYAYANVTHDEMEAFLFDKAHNTQRAYRRTYREFFQTPGVPQRIEDIKYVHFLRFLKRYANHRDRGSCRAIALKSLFRHLHLTERLTRNPAAILKAPKPRRIRVERYLSSEQVRRILDVARVYGERFYLSIAILYYCGLRRGEAANIQCGDVYQREEHVIVSVDGKTGVRRITVPKVIANSLLNEAQKGLAKSSLFSISTSTLYSRVKQCAKEAGLSPLPSPHFLRHAHAANSLSSGASIYAIQRTLGHASLTSTTRYMHDGCGRSSGSYL